MTVLAVEQGSDFAVEWPLFQADGVTLLDASVGGWTARGQVRAYVEAPDVLYALAPVPGNGKLTLAIPAADSTAWAWRKAVWDIELIDPSGNPGRVDSGVVVVLPEVTR